MEKKSHSHVSTPIVVQEEEVKVIQQDMDGEEGSGGHASVTSFQNYIEQGQNLSNMGELSQTDSAIEEMCPAHNDIYVAFSKKL